MTSVIGVFRNGADALRSAHRVSDRVKLARVRILAPEAAATPQLESVPTDDAEQPGMGGTIGAVAGGALGAAAASLLVPPVGAVTILGLAAGALLGAGSGALAGDALEDNMSMGVPRDEMPYYDQQLQEGRVLVVALLESDADADTTRAVLAESGAEQVNPARDDPWTGLRDEATGGH